MAKVGIDFGTANSSVMFYDEKGKKDYSLLMDDKGEEKSFAPSIMYITKDGKIATGWSIPKNMMTGANRQFVIRDLKRKLLDDTSFQVFRKIKK